MAKQLHTINQFHGGLNTNGDPRDIADNELSSATDVMVDSLGRITMMGGNTSQGAAAQALQITAGHGLFSLSSDYVFGNVKTVASVSSDSGAKFASTSHGFLDGDIIFHHGFSEATYNGIKTVANKTTNDYKTGDAYTDNSSGTATVASGLTATSDNWLVLGDATTDAKVYLYSNSKTKWYEIIDFGTFSNMQFSYYTVDGITRVCDANFSNNTTPKLFGYFKNNFQNSLASSEFSVQDTTLTAPVVDVEADDGASPGANHADNQVSIWETGHASNDTDYATSPHPGEFNVQLRLADTIQGVTDGTWKFNDGSSYSTTYYASYLYDSGLQESTLTSHDTVGEPQGSVLAIEVALLDTSALINPRIRGIRFYYKTEGAVDTGDNNQYLLFELILGKGLRLGNESNYYEHITTSNIMIWDTGPIQRQIYGDTFQTLNGFAESTEVSARWKSSVVTNRRAYIANVYYPVGSSGIVYGDRMIKSDVNKFDTFLESNIIEATVNDGDQILKLEEYADRILQFKEKKMHLINVSQELEFLEDTFHHKGISHPDATCKTDYGIAWANSFGCYLYNGEHVSNLLEREGVRLISSSDWSSFITANSTIGYIPLKRQILVLKDCTATSVGDIYLFDIITQSWTYGNSKLIDSQIKSNLANDWDGNLICVHTSGTGTVIKWDDAADSSSTVDIRTKDIDFGQPGQKKKIYKVYLTFRGNATHVQVNYGVDGLNPASTFYSITSGTDGSSTGGSAAAKCIPYDAGVTDWLSAELKPSSSINNISSFRLKISGDGSNAISSDFEINDISIVYRGKTVK